MDYYQVTFKEKKGEILIDGIIGSFFSDNGVQGKKFVEDFKKLESKYDDIDIRILNSPGGSIFEGLSIVNTIKASEKNITIYIDSLAASMAGWVALSGNRLFMAKTARIMIHRPSGGVIGNSDQLRNIADELDKFEDDLVDELHNKTGHQKKWIKDNWLTDMDKYITADEAKRNRLIDGIYPNGHEVPDPQDKKINVFQYYDDKLKLTDMENIKMFNELVGISADSKESDLFKKVAEIVKANQALTQLETDKTNLELEVEQLKDKVDQLEKDQKDQVKVQATDLIETAIKDGKLTIKDDKEKTDWIDKATENFDTIKALLDSIPNKKSQTARDTLHNKILSQQTTTTQVGDQDENKLQLAKEWDQLHRSGGLMQLKKNDYDRYEMLYIAKYGKKPTVIKENMPEEN